jgi:NDP-sugar pyrophosphorylase family protein
VGGRLYAAVRGVSWGARVHYKALVELSIVKKGATVGAGVTLKNCFVDEGAIICEGAHLSGCVVGKGAVVTPNTVANLCVIYPGAMQGQLVMQASVLGKNSGAFAHSNFYDLNFSRNIRVSHRGRVVDSGTQMLGCCLGPEGRVAGGVWVASGREVPGGSLIIQRPTEVATYFGEPLRGEPQVVENSKVVPLKKVARDGERQG